MSTEMLELDGGDLFVCDRLAFRVTDEYVNAWGFHCVAGRLFDMATMTFQRDAVATCNIRSTRRDIVAAAFRKVLT